MSSPLMKQFTPSKFPIKIVFNFTRYDEFCEKKTQN